MYIYRYSVCLIDVYLSYKINKHLSNVSILFLYLLPQRAGDNKNKLMNIKIDIDIV